MKEFDPYQYCTKEFNSIYNKLRQDIGHHHAVILLRHDNNQLVDDDWRTDLEKDLDRRHEELMSSLGSKGPEEIFDWVSKTKIRLEGYGHWYWDAAESFFTEVCASSLPNYLSDEEVNKLMVTLNKRLVEYIEKLKHEKDNISKEIDRLGVRKNEAMAELAGVNVKIDKKKDEFNDITTRQAALYKEVSNLEKEMREKQENFHKELKKKYDEMEKEMKERYEKMEDDAKNNLSEITKKASVAEKNLNGIVKRNKIAKFVDGIFGGGK